MAIKHGRKDAKPGKSQKNNQSSLAPEATTGMPMVQDPGQRMFDPTQALGANLPGM